MDRIAVLDSGGQYCHLIARKVRELGVYSEILPIDVPPPDLRSHRGVILSGGPSSVFDPRAPMPDPGLFALGMPMLGICYGHQIIAHYLGGTVDRGESQEFGSASLRVRADGGLFDGMARQLQVWMSHGDHVGRVPPGFEILGETDDCDVAAMGNPEQGVYGLQFHPEVVHTPGGTEILSNFLGNACGCAMDWHPRDRVDRVVADIAEEVADRKVLFFLSGGVDSTVAFALTTRAIGSERVEGVYVDTGFMRGGETAEIESAFSALNLGGLRTIDAADRFMGQLRGVVDPERKRVIIGEAFVDVQDQILGSPRYAGHDWVLGQGTIYPDTIESGGTHSSDVIKTHHNRVRRIQELLDQGRVLEPLSEFYKDEVRELGRAAGLPEALVARHPFPGPGLAIRCLCVSDPAASIPSDQIAAVARQDGYGAFLLPLRSVGVQGDSRSYAQVTVLHGGAFDYDRLLALSTAITNDCRDTNRIVFALTPRNLRAEEWSVRPASLTRERVGLLQSADRLVTDYLRDSGLYDEVWQCPVVLLPWGCEGGETVALRPITSVDGMTAAVARLPAEGLFALAQRLHALEGVDGVLFDVSHKPPSTIEWE